MCNVVRVLKMIAFETEAFECFHQFVDLARVVRSGRCIHVLLQCFESGVVFLLRDSAVGRALEEHRLGDLLADLHDRVQRGQRVLEDHGDLVAADVVEVLFGDLQKVLAVIQDLAAFDDGVACEDAEDRLCRNGLAGTGLTDDRKCLTALQIEGDIADRLQRTGLRAERDL